MRRNAFDHARKTIDLKSVSVTVVQSDLFAALDNTYDLIFFNSVYIPRKIGQTLRIDTLHSYETDRCGGNDGIETILTNENIGKGSNEDCLPHRIPDRSRR
jgi:methylase of polypeptide subunit release factors